MNDVAQAFIDKSRSLLMTDYLPKIERCLESLSDEEVWWRAGEESNSIGNLLLHLSGNARQWIVSGVGQAADRRARQAEFDERATRPRQELMVRLKQTLDEVDDVLDRLPQSELLEQRMIQGHDVTVIEAIFHVVEHFSMHTGQIILLTKIIKRKNLNFYDFSTGAPLPNWHQPRGES
jgi:uncharacterized damage-inducible protein DinB